MSTAVLANPVRPAQTPRTISWTTGFAALFVAAMFYVADQAWRFSELDLGEEIMESSTVEGNPMRRLGLLVLGAAGAALVIRRGGEALRTRGARLGFAWRLPCGVRRVCYGPRIRGWSSAGCLPTVVW